MRDKVMSILAQALPEPNYVENKAFGWVGLPFLCYIPATTLAKSNSKPGNMVDGTDVAKG